uniref:Uncharacterized protein n=1 Tax=Arundo donax TaxID=35708 RepID=A0A0A9AJ78_ARUDO
MRIGTVCSLKHSLNACAAAFQSWDSVSLLWL